MNELKTKYLKNNTYSKYYIFPTNSNGSMDYLKKENDSNIKHSYALNKCNEWGNKSILPLYRQYKNNLNKNLNLNNVITLLGLPTEIKTVVNQFYNLSDFNKNNNISPLDKLLKGVQRVKINQNYLNKFF